MNFCLDLGLALLFWLQVVTPAVPNQLGPRSRVFHETHKAITPSEQTLCTSVSPQREDSEREFLCDADDGSAAAGPFLSDCCFMCSSPAKSSFADKSGFLQSDTWLSRVCPGRASLVLLTPECLKQMNTEPAQQL